MIFGDRRKNVGDGSKGLAASAFGDVSLPLFFSLVLCHSGGESLDGGGDSHVGIEQLKRNWI